jgi:amino acid adenylation domain-containing protein
MKEKIGIEKIYSLTPMQEGMLFHSLADTGSFAYFQQYSLSVKGELDRSLLEKSFNTIIARHSIFRTVFNYEAVEKPLQIVLKKRNLKIYFNDISHLSKEEVKSCIDEFKNNDRKKGFNLAKDILLRVSLFKTGNSSYTLIWSFHHILMDGWCVGIIISELIHIYRSLKQGKAPELGPVEPYWKYIRWLSRQDREEGLSYWKKELEGYEHRAALPQAGPPAEEGEYIPEEYSFIIDEESTRTLQKIAGESQVTINNLFQTLWGILLQKYNNCRDVVFGTVVSGRPPEIDRIEKIVGLFINTVPLRIKSGDRQTFLELLKQVGEKTVKTNPYEYLPLADIQAGSQLKRNLLEHIMVYENYPVQEKVKTIGRSQDIGFEISDLHSVEQTSYDFNVLIFPRQDITLRFSYNSYIYDSRLIKRTALHLKEIIKQVIKHPGVNTAEIEITGDEEKKDILEISSGPVREFDVHKTVHQLFQEKAAAVGEKAALIFAGKELSYRELNEKSNRLARTLRTRGVKAGSVVGIMPERSFEMVIGILGILKAGGAYLPIDPEYPANRKRYMMEDSKVNLLLVNYDMYDTGDPSGDIPGNIDIMDLEDEKIYADDGSNLDCINKGSDLFYVIYTSGSTGKPKGAMLEHRNILNLLMFQYFYTPVDFSRVLQFSAIGFDPLLLEIFSTLLYGGRLYLVNSETRNNIPDLLNIIGMNKIKTLIFPPSYLKFIFSVKEYSVLFPGCLEHIITSGEQAVITENSRKYLERNHVYFHNQYGPAETHVATMLTLAPGKEIPSLPDIGKPIMNTAIYLLDKDMHLQPVGVPGEIYIGGLSVGRGYFGREDLTAEKFIDNPFARGDRLYRTGDLARRGPDGSIEFLGRIDHQLKIRGSRVEPGEIETRLQGIEKIKEAVVTAREEGGDKYLCAYLVSAGEIDISEIKESLSKDLPGYMIPSYFILIDKIPLTANGKIDRGALPAPDTSIKETYAPPRDKTEKKLVEICSGILAIEKDTLGIDANFFDSGGHSLKAIMLSSRIHKELDVKITLREIFDHPTIRGLSGYINAAARNKHVNVEAVEKKEYYELSSAQKRLFIRQQMDENNTSYNIPEILVIEGVLAGKKLEKAFRDLIARHESFRTSFEMIGNRAVQKIHENVEFKIDYKESPGGVEDILRGFVRPFDLSTAPLLRLILIKLENEKHLLGVDIHHITADGTSMDILVKDFALLYRGEKLPALRVRYRDYSQRQNRLLKSGVIKEQEEYWLSRFKGDLPYLDMPTDYPRPETRRFDGNVIGFELGRELTARTRKLVLETGTTLYMVLMAVCSILFSKYAGQQDIVVGSSISGRNHADLQNIIGMFVNMLPMRNRPGEHKTFGEFLEEVKENALAAYDNQDYQYDELVNRLGLQGNLRRSPLFDVVFAFRTGDPHTGKKDNAGVEEFDRLKLSSFRRKHMSTQFDLVIDTIEYDDIVKMSLRYSTHLFKEPTAEKMIKYYIEILDQVVESKNMKLKDITVSSGLTEIKSTITRDDPDDFNF